MSAPTMTTTQVVDAVAGRRAVRSTRVLGWALVTLGVGHLGTVAATAASDQDTATEQALDGLARVAVPLPGPRHTLDQVFDGYSLLMGLMTLTVGLLVVLIARHSADAPEPVAVVRPVLWLGGAVCAVGLAISVVLMPVPPVVGLAVGLGACAVGLTAGERRQPRAAVRTSSSRS